MNENDYPNSQTKARNDDFLDGVEQLGEQYPDENDPFWESFWILKRTSELCQRLET